MAVPKKSGAKEQGQDKGANSPPEFTREQELRALRDMLLIRRFEEKAGQLYGMGAIGGFCHLYIGQEAIVVGMQMALKNGDQVITGYRDHGQIVGRLVYEHMLKRPQALYGTDLGSNYQAQGLKLSKHFRAAR